MSRRISFFVTGSLDPLRTLEFRGLLTALRARLSSGTIAAGRIIAVVDRTGPTDVAERLADEFDLELFFVSPPDMVEPGYMPNQYKFMKTALSLFEKDDILVKLRTDYNRSLHHVLDSLTELLAHRPEVLTERLIVERASIVTPGRINDINLAGTKRNMERIATGEMMMTAKYGSVSHGAEFRWFGQLAVSHNPVFLNIWETIGFKRLAQALTARLTGAEHDPDPDLTSYLLHLNCRFLNETVYIADQLPPGPPPPLPDLEALAWGRTPYSMFERGLPDLRLCSQRLVDAILSPDADPNGIYENLRRAAQAVSDQPLETRLSRVTAAFSDTPHQRVHRTPDTKPDDRQAPALTERQRDLITALNAISPGLGFTLRRNSAFSDMLDKHPDRIDPETATLVLDTLLETAKTQGAKLNDKILPFVNLAIAKCREDDLEDRSSDLLQWANNSDPENVDQDRRFVKRFASKFQSIKQREKS